MNNDRITKISYMTSDDYLSYQVGYNCKLIEFCMQYVQTRDTGEIPGFRFIYDIYQEGYNNCFVSDTIDASDVLVVEYESGEVVE